MAFKFLFQLLFGAVLTACESNRAHDSPTKNVVTRTRAIYAIADSVDARRRSIGDARELREHRGYQNIEVKGEPQPALRD